MTLSRKELMQIRRNLIAALKSTENALGLPDEKRAIRTHRKRCRGQCDQRHDTMRLVK